MRELFWYLVSLPFAIMFVFLVKYLQGWIIYCVACFMAWITGPWAPPLSRPVRTAKQELEELRERVKNKQRERVKNKQP